MEPLKPNNPMVRQSGQPMARARTPMGAPQQSAMNITPKQIIDILRRHLLMIIICTIIGTFIGGVSWFLFSKFRNDGDVTYTSCG